MAEARAQKSQSLPTLQDLTGTSVRRFAIRARLGSGGMGEVYLADDTKLKRSVALKRMAPRVQADEHYRRRFLKEAESASRLSYEHIASVYDVFEENGEIFLVMEYVEGQTLRQRLASPLALDEFLEIAGQCAAALAAAHDRGIVHRDIKPENIMLTPAGQVKVLDFGVAKRLPPAEESLTVDNLAGTGLSGTLGYMAPEVLLHKKPNGRADTFSLGVVLYEALTGHHPFLATTLVGTCDRILHDTPRPISQFNPRVSPELERVVTKMLRKDQGDRYATARDLEVDLRALQRGVPYPVTPPAPLPIARATRRVYPALAAIMVLLCGVTYWTWRRQPRPVLPAPAATAKRLAVLPFENLSGRSEDEYFADGLTAEMITTLSRARSLEVISRISSMRFKKTRLPISDIVSQLRVDYIVSGTVQRADSEARITVALVEASRGTQLWARNYDRPFKDILAVETEVADNVVQSLALVLGEGERAALTTPATQDPYAFDAYLRGKSLVANFNNRGRDADFEAAERTLGEAIALDPQMAAAFAELARLYYMHDIERARPTPDRDRARTTAERSLAIDPLQVSALTALAILYAWSDENEKAYSYAQKVLDLNPHESLALMTLGHSYNNWGLLAEALEAFRRAGRADPLYIYPATNAAVTLGMLGRFEEAWTENEKAAALEQDNWGVLLNRIWIRYHQGRLDDAKQLVADAKKRLPASEWPLAEVLEAWVLSQRGQHERARAILRRSQQAPILQASLSFQLVLAEGWALESQKQQSLKILERVISKKPNYPWLARDTNLDPLRDDPRFQALMAKLHSHWEDYRVRYGQPSLR